MKGDAEAKSDAELDRAASSRVSPPGNEDLLFVPQSPDTQRERRSAAAVSLISSAANDHDVAEAAKTLRNSEGLETVKFPKPSFSRMATGLFVHAVVTMTSGKLSPFTSRDVICSPPVGAVMPTVCPLPPLR